MNVAGQLTLDRPARIARPVGSALVFGAVFVALLSLGDQLLGDPDTYWHVAVGERFWAGGGFPWTDTFSHTFAGQPWIAKEWLSQALLAAAHAVAGWRGTVVLTAAAFGGTVALLHLTLAARLRSTLALGATLLAVLFLLPHLLARPHVLALLPLLCWTRTLVAAGEAGRAPRPTALLGLALWANLHGSVSFAYPLLALLAADAIWVAPPPRRRALAGRWLCFGIGALLAGIATPYGPASLGVTAQIFGSGESLPFITEWQPLALDAIGCTALAIAAAAGVLLALDGRRSAFRLLLLLLLVAMTLRHTRFLDVFAIVTPLLLVSPVLRRWPGLAREAEPRPTAREAAFRASVSPWLPRIALAALAVVLLAATDPRPRPAVTPAAALGAAVRAELVGKPVYNAYDFGGYLIARGVPTFIDGRTDQLFLGGFISTLYGLVRGNDDAAFGRFVEDHGARWALVEPVGDEARHFDRLPGWHRIHRDAVAAVYRRE